MQTGVLKQHSMTCQEQRAGAEESGMQKLRAHDVGRWADALVRGSFLQLPSIGPRGEQRLWRAGIRSWECFRSRRRITGFGTARKAFLNRQLSRAEESLRAGRFEELGFPSSEHWRLPPLLAHADSVVYLDIETSAYYGDITVLGCWDGEQCLQFVQGWNLEKDLVRRFLARFRMVVTFNGSSFDLPILERFFRGVLPAGMLHMDLRHVLGRLGFRGGLKRIEEELGIRREAAARLEGDEAVLLWQEFRLTGEVRLLERLLTYNAADCRNLEELSSFAVPRLWASMRAEAGL